MQNFSGGNVQGVDSPISNVGVEVQPLLRLTYLWMSLGVLVTAFVAFLTSQTPALLELAMNPAVMMVSLFGSLGLVLGLSFGIRRMSPTLATVMFFVYAAVLGFSLSTIFIVYELGAIYAAFFTTAGLFGAMTVVGFTTSVDLSKYSTYFMMGLIGLVIAMVVNMFLQSGPFDFLISIVGVILFTGLTAWDTQKLKNMSMAPELQDNNDMTMRLSVMGALMLYLDFINLFLFLLRLFGGGRD